MSDKAASPGVLLARIDRIPIWALPSLFAGVIGVGFLFTFYDIFDINVSFIQTCMELVKGCTPPTSAQYIGPPVLLNLLGYVVGTLVFSPLSDRAGRRDLLLVTMLITGIGSILTALVTSYTWFNVARLITGIGIGADLAIVNTYVGEMAPQGARAKYISMIFIFSAVGAVLGIWVGLWLTTPATPLPLGLPFALASHSFDYGWRVMYIIGGVLALIGVLLRFQLPESPRWLITRGRLAEAEAVVADMEARASRIGPLPAVNMAAVVEPKAEERMPYSAIFSSPIYRSRTIMLLLMWFCAYITVYSLAAGFTVLLAALHYEPPEAGLITAVGTFGFVLCAIVAYGWGEKMERRTWVPLAALITLIGGIIVALGGADFWVSVVGSIIVFFGFNIWVPIAYTWSVEQYPTRARTTGFALVDGIGHIGGGIGLLIIAPIIPHMSVLGAMLLIIVFLIIAAIIAQFGMHTRDRALDDISP